MIIIFGGAYQGKLDFAKEKFNIKDEEILDLSKENFSLDKKVIYHFEEVKKKNISFNEADLNNKILILDDESCGLVPINDEDRRYREDIGRLMVKLSKEADEVYRVFIGLGERIK